MGIKLRVGPLYMTRCGAIIEVQDSRPDRDGDVHVKVFKLPKDPLISLTGKPGDRRDFTMNEGLGYSLKAETGMRGDSFRNLDAIRAIEP
jgi:hypothetical protein